ncbi:MAG TPA: MBL fold metallo-hydrolase [Rectinemataceae bacterium]|nr:MBL fold metallo-hydrolase [Rectinemataceae bacterium]
MDIRFLGTGSAFNPIMDNSNAFFTVGKKFFLLDCGETAFGRIWNLPAYLDCEEVIAIVTHLHADHVGSLGSLISYSHYVTGKKVTVVHPLETIVHLLDLVGINRACYRFQKLRQDETGSLEAGVTIKPLVVDHVPDMTCFGYIISDGGESVYFSGDAKSVPDEVVEGLKSGAIDKAYQDTSNRESDHPTHASLSYLEALIPPRFRHKVYCIHLDYDYRDLLLSKGFGVVTIEA